MIKKSQFFKSRRIVKTEYFAFDFFIVKDYLYGH
jgi:hypothetical protein